MEVKAKVGDVVTATAGRDKGNNFLVIESDETCVFIVDGKTRKVNAPKKKNQKHIKVILSEEAITLAEKIARGEPVGNDRIKTIIRQCKNKK